MVGDRGAVLLADRDAGEQPRQQAGAERINLVEQQPRTRADSMSRKQPGSGRRLEDNIVRSNLCSAGGEVGQRHRCRELLKRDLALAPISLRRQRSGDLGHALKHLASRRSCIGQGCRRVELSDNLGDLERVVSIAHRPGAIGVARPERRGHISSQRKTADLGTHRDLGGKPTSHGEQRLVLRGGDEEWQGVEHRGVSWSRPPAVIAGVISGSPPHLPMPIEHS